MSLLIAALAAVAASIVAITFLQTRAEYATLPNRVPLSIRFDGTVNTYGPRAAVWLLPAVQVISLGAFLASGFALVTKAPATHGSLTGLAAFAPCVLAVFWRAQKLLITGARTTAKRIPMGGFWVFLVAMLGAGSIAIAVL